MNFMARQINLFAFTGSLGNVVGYCYKGQYCLRRKPVRNNKKQTLAQVTHREKFSRAIKFVSTLSPLLAITIPPMKKMTESNYIMSHTMRNAMYGTYPHFNIYYSQVPVSRGRLQQAWDEQVTAAAGNVIFTWKDNSANYHAKENDKAILIVYCEALNQCIYSTNSVDRRTGEAILPVKPFRGHLVQTWLAFRSENGKDVSNSTYTGALYIT
jgi:hypothetical protein